MAFLRLNMLRAGRNWRDGKRNRLMMHGPAYSDLIFVMSPLHEQLMHRNITKLIMSIHELSRRRTDEELLAAPRSASLYETMRRH